MILAPLPSTLADICSRDTLLMGGGDAKKLDPLYIIQYSLDQ